MALQPSGSLCHTPLESTSRPLHVEGPRRGSLGTVWASQLGPRHIHPSAAGTRATPPGRGIQHRLPGHQPVLEVFPPLAWVSSGDPAVSDCTPQEQPGTRCFPSRHVCRCPVPWGSASPALPGLPRPLSARLSWLGLASACQIPAGHPLQLQDRLEDTCVALHGAKGDCSSVCGPLPTAGDPEDCSTSSCNRRPAVRTEQQWAGEREGQPGSMSHSLRLPLFTARRDRDIVCTAHPGMRKRLVAAWGDQPRRLATPGPAWPPGTSGAPERGHAWAGPSQPGNVPVGHRRAGHIPAEGPVPPAVELPSAGRDWPCSERSWAPLPLDTPSPLLPGRWMGEGAEGCHHRY